MTDLAVDVDVVVLTLQTGDGGEPGPPVVALREVDEAACWALPGEELRADEDLEATAGRVLAATVGTVRHLEQLSTFGAPQRLPARPARARRVVSVTYLGLLPAPVPLPAPLAWHPAASPPPLFGDHDAILRAGVERLRAKLTYSTVAFGLLPDAFTLSELQAVYEAVVGHALDKRNFRKKVLGLGVVVQAEGQRRGSHRPAQLYRFARPQLVLLDDVIAT